MAISPEHLKAGQRERLAGMEKFIDDALAGATAKYGNKICVSPPNFMTLADWNILKSKYLELGWKSAEYRSDQREGDWLEFEF